MSQSVSSNVLDELLDPVSRCLTREVARSIAELRAPPHVQQKMDDLAEKSTEGTLTPTEMAEYEIRVRTLNFIGVLQAKARAVIAADTSR